MPASFWSNTIWYILLGITSIVTFALALRRSKNMKFTIAFAFAALGFVYIIEYVVLVIFKGYDYYPRLVDDPFQDSVLGNIFSQVSIAATSAFAIVYKLSYKWYAVFSVIYFSIEELFTKLGIYQHNWYSSLYTLIGFSLIFIMIKLWHDNLIRTANNKLYYSALFLSVVAIKSNTFTLPMKLLEIQIFQIDFWGEFSRNHTTTVIIYDLVIIPALIFIHLCKLHWVWKTVFISILICLRYLMFISNTLIIYNGLFIPLTMFDLIYKYFLVIVMDSFLQEGVKPHRKTGLRFFRRCGT